eukprot:Protomagalhaensia_wolfi_Nauph_80__71@NODE_1042_length_1777_cov_30_096663_g787_i0_p1_GENE_NODE_1042_length_1777_cov_30_096663_g787_i0NODE_1042_length_1777_cov_30_096663_g787_i0_p1_ORF_typecomplete_len384_score56_57Bax1I/PF01027_20/1_7e07DUF2842/PF11003_8/0_018DUF2842/PF11003_8/7_9e03Mem_trans/PF03547_18/0_28DUF2339/PF10101_9/1_2Tetraspanin/PF00335_20/6_4IgaA/PF07095_11/1_8_NODE_1042_length_1777_cov_30_096663_g787_i01591310
MTWTTDDPLPTNQPPPANKPLFQPTPYSPPPEPQQYHPNAFPHLDHQCNPPLVTGVQDDGYRFREYPVHQSYPDYHGRPQEFSGYPGEPPLDYSNRLPPPTGYHHEGLQGGYSGYPYGPPNLEPRYPAPTNPLGADYGPPSAEPDGGPEGDRPPAPAEARRPLTLKFDEDARRDFVRVVYSLLACQLTLMAAATAGLCAVHMDMLRTGLILFVVGLVLYIVLAVWFIYRTPRNASVNGIILILTAMAWALQLAWIDGIIPSVGYWLAPAQSAVAAALVAALTYQTRIKFMRWHIYACVLAEILLVHALLTAIPRFRNGAAVGTSLASLSAIIVIASTIAIGQQLCRGTHPYLSVEPHETLLAAASLFYYRKTYDVCEPQRSNR